MSNPWESEAILRDVNGDPIPQLWDGDNNEFIPYVGKIVISGNDLQYYWNHDDGEPDPGANARVFGARYEVDGNFTGLYWNGTSWEVV